MISVPMCTRHTFDAIPTPLQVFFFNQDKIIWLLLAYCNYYLVLVSCRRKRCIITFNQRQTYSMVLLKLIHFFSFPTWKSAYFCSHFPPEAILPEQCTPSNILLMYSVVAEIVTCTTLYFLNYFFFQILFILIFSR